MKKELTAPIAKNLPKEMIANGIAVSKSHKNDFDKFLKQIKF